jgi:hypothetical protein
MSEPIYEAILAAHQRPRVQPSEVAPEKSAISTLVSELDGCAFLADGTRRGELVPLADFTRHRMAKTLRAASAALTALPDDGRLLTPGIARVAAEHHGGFRLEDHRDATRRDLMKAAECYLLVAESGADGWHNPDGSYAPPGGWPWPDCDWFPSKDREENLVIAGAFVAEALEAPAASDHITT